MNPPEGILTPSTTRALLDRLQLRPRKQLGQNFLVDGNIVRKSLELAQIAAGDRVVEIGPGLGTLTAALLDAGAEVFAVERDGTLSAHVRTTLGPAYPHRLHLMEGDAVDHPLAGLPAAVARETAPLSMQPGGSDPRGFKIVANLPYAISSPWMEAVLGGSLPVRMVLMLQLEVAQRYSASPGSKAFSAISVFLQAAYRVARGHRVANRCFYPMPEVDSTLLNLERIESPYRFSNAGRALVRPLFQQRRKQVASLIRRTTPAAADCWHEMAATHGIRADVRAEGVSVAAWIDLDRLLRGEKR